MPAELSNALYRKAQQGQIAVGAAIQLVDDLMSRGITLWEPLGLHSRAMEVAATLERHAVYDSHYLALAEILDCDLWTADERFFRSATTDFPRVRWIGQI